MRIINKLKRWILDARIRWNIAVIEEMKKKQNVINRKVFSATLLVARLQTQLDRVNSKSLRRAG